jgi:soluble lytic murein transglycosylase-like protein
MPRLVLVSALLLAAGTPAAAEIVLLTNGQTFAVTAHRVDGDEVQLALYGGGEVRLAVADVATVLPDEVVRREAAPEPEQPAAVAATDWETLAKDTAHRHRVDAGLVRAIIDVESGFRPRAVSPKGAMGLMQLMPTTAAELGVTDPFDPEQNVDGGVRYLRALLTRYGGDQRLALAAYNAGSAAVERHGGIPPYSETRSYVKKVLARYRKVRQ